MFDDPYHVPLSAFLARERKALADAPAVLGPLLMRIAQRVARDLYEPDLLDDVVSTAFEHLLAQNVRPFDPSRGTASAFLYGFVLRAAEQVRSGHGATGVKKIDARRRLQRDETSDVAQAQHLRSARRVALVDPMDPVDAMIDLQRALPNVMPLRRAVLMLSLDDMPFALVARDVGWDRTTLRRRLRHWAQESLEKTA